ncbi:hypothetical protein BaRGS_00022669 [Batillaria attramentaria]|uniref:Uncharacterized protein n=1 Tax=Batillaria attramentaria TaxID=370345 RepID=A0ABD0KFW8_9CAEN
MRRFRLVASSSSPEDLPLHYRGKLSASDLTLATRENAIGVFIVEADATDISSVRVFVRFSFVTTGWTVTSASREWEIGR